MQKNAYFSGLTVPLLLLLPQLAITLVFFYWPASQAVWQSFLLQDAFGTSTEFVWFENYVALFNDPGYFKALVNTAIFSTFVCILSLSIALLFAVMADRRGGTPGSDNPPSPRTAARWRAECRRRSRRSQC